MIINRNYVKSHRITHSYGLFLSLNKKTLRFSVELVSHLAITDGDAFSFKIESGRLYFRLDPQGIKVSILKHRNNLCTVNCSVLIRILLKNFNTKIGDRFYLGDMKEGGWYEMKKQPM